MSRRAPFVVLAFTALASASSACAPDAGDASLEDPTLAAATLVVHQEAETMSKTGSTGQDGTRATLYSNNDAVYNAVGFAQAGRYDIKVRGASSNSSAAGLSVYVASGKVGALSFSGTAYAEKTVVFDVSSSGSKEIRLKLETDNGSNDTYVDWYELSYQGATPPPPPAPVPPSTGAFASGTYRNLFKEWDSSITDSAVQTKLNQFWSSLFAGTDDNLRVYYPAGSNSNGAMAYIKDVNNGDVRSEGQSYGMMIAVQMNKRAEFDALWNWAKTYMQHQSGARKGYFAWQVGTGGSKMDNNPASDGEAYFATALFFAAGRWGNGTGIYDYVAEANAILDAMLHKEDMNGGVVESVTNMFNRTQKMVVFTPYASAANFTDPSYHLPAFYELWGRWAAGYDGQQAADRQFWLDAAATSRSFFARTTNATTGLGPDYAEFSGAPNNTGNHGDFRFDAWRTAVNWSVDYAWFAKDANEKTLSDRIQAFFEGQGVSSYGNQYSLSGNQLDSSHSPGLVASNGAASLAATNSRAWKFVAELWNLQPPSGQYRYYDGLLSFMGLLHASGNFRIYTPSGSGGGTSYTLTVSKSGAGNGTVTSSTGGISCGSTCSASYASGTTVTLTASAASGSTFAGWSGSCSGTSTTCSVSMTAGRTVTATFNGSGGGTTYSLQVSKSGTGSGTVTSSTGGINCGSTCSASYSSGTTVTLTASAASGSTFGGWSGSCTGASATCTVSMTASRSVTATFNTSGGGGGSTDPYAQLEAENAATKSGTTQESADGGTVVSFSSSSSYLVFNNLNFGTGAASVQFRVSTTSPGANLQVRVGSRTASPACVVYPDGNGSWHLKSNGCWPRPNGTQSIYITTTGPLKINWLKFSR